MEQCKDCIHNTVCDRDVGYGYFECPHFKNTADVVPKSEVAKIFEENKRYKETVGSLAVKNGEVVGITVGKEVRYIEKGIADVFKNMAVAKAKAEVAREIFEEIELIIRKHDECPKYQLMLNLAELKKKYTEDVK